MIITQTPLRISLAGGGTDFREFYSITPGRVLSTAIDKYVYAIIKNRFDDKIGVSYSKKEIVDGVSEIQHELVREAMRITGVSHGVDITTLADVPSEGSGLGSSSSVTVGLLNALYTYQGEQVTAERLASEACQIEMDILGKPMGKQDAYIAAYGGVRVFQFNPDESVNVRFVRLVNEQHALQLGEALLLFYTGRTRRAETILTEQVLKTTSNLIPLNQIRSLVDQTETAILEEDYNRIGALLHLNWVYKTALASRISDGEIDELYQRAIGAGATGGKIAGAGGGGFLLLAVPKHKQDFIREELKDLRELEFELEPYGSRVIFNTGRD